MEKKIEKKIVYFETGEPGHENTEVTLDLAVGEAQKRGITKIVLASTTGETAQMAAARVAGTGITLIVILTSSGSPEASASPRIWSPNCNNRDTGCILAPCSSTPTTSMDRERPKRWP